MREPVQPPLRIEPYYSPRLALYLFVAHGVALTVVISMARPWWFAVGLLAAVLYSLLLNYRRHLQYQGRWTILSVEIDGQGEWWLQQGNGDVISVQLQPTSYIHQQLTVLNFRSQQGKRYSLLLLPDGIDAESFRRLRVRLRSF